MTRRPTEEELSHERLGEKFATALSDYDVSRRVEILIDEFLPGACLVGKTVLDVGCGLGFLSERLHQRGGIVTASDISPTLVERTRRRVGCVGVAADALDLRAQFGSDRFDVVVSSECIEHTPEPARAVEEMVAVLKPGGYLSLSTPNLLWSPVVRATTTLRLRPFNGHENFSTWSGLRRVLHRSGATVVREKGLHLFPFQLPLHRLSRWSDKRLQVLRVAMINICILAQKGRS